MNRQFLTLATAVLFLVTAFVSCKKDRGGSGSSGGDDADSPFAGTWIMDGSGGNVTMEIGGTTWVVKHEKTIYCSGEYGYKGTAAVLEITNPGESSAERGDVGAAKISDDTMTVSGFSDGILNGTFTKKGESEELKGIKFKEDEITLTKEAKRILELVAIPSGADLPQCNFTSDDPGIATVNKTTGEVTAVAEGLAVITATTPDGKFTANCFVTVVSGSALVIDATVVNGNDYNSKIAIVKAFVLGEYESYEAASGQYVNGGFKLNLPEIVSYTYLNDLDYVLPLYYLEGTISDPEAKMTDIRINAYDKSANYIGQFLCTDSYDGNNWMFYVYVDRNVTIKGYTSYYDYNVYDCSFTKGWNIIYSGWNNGYYEYTTKKPSGIDYKWHYYDGWKKSPGEKDKPQHPFSKMRQ